MDQKVLRQLQLVETEILRYVDEFCSRNNIEYSLYAGTQIGAVRHGGFIPWDDDIDILMRRNEYEKFIKAWHSAEHKDYFLENIETNKRCNNNHTKIRKNNTVFMYPDDVPNNMHQGVWIDIFPFDKVKNTFWAKNYIKIWSLIRIATARVGLNREKDTKVVRVLKSAFRLLPQAPKLWLNKKSNKAVAKYKDLNENYLWADLSIARLKPKYFSAEILNDITKTNFEGYEFSIVSDCDTMLKKIYGNYMELPPEKERVCKHNPIEVKF